MQISKSPMVVTDWSNVTAVDSPGESGFARRRIQPFGDIQVRLIEFSPGYREDWCTKGHLLLCLDGEMEIELQCGKKYLVRAGSSFQVGDGEPPHRKITTNGCAVFVVD